MIEAFESNDKPQHLIKFASGTIESLDKEKASQAHKGILNTYGVPTDRRL